MIKFIKSIIKSIGYGIKDDPEVQKLYQKHPKVLGFIKRRLTPYQKYGLFLTIGIFFTLFFIYIFFKVIQSYVGQETLYNADLRIINLISHLRSPNFNQFMLFITDLGNAQVITIAVVFSIIILSLLRKWSYLKNLLIFVFGGQLFVFLIKDIIERPRPPLANALVAETSYSFPSGHTFVAVAFYGLITFFLFDSFQKKRSKIITIILGTILVTLIGASRIYLGAHWPSDVIASYASGFAWLSVIITITLINKKFDEIKITTPHLKIKDIKLITSFLIIIFFAFVYFFYKTHPLKAVSTTPIIKTIIQPNEINTKLFENLPKVSESITGVAAEPINIIIVAKKEVLNKAFINSGWFLLDPINPKTAIKIITTFIDKQTYDQTPGLPVFWDTRTNDFGFGKPESTDSRQHIHFWETNFATPDDQTIWVGTAHFDQKIKTKGFLILPIHTTEPIVDNEREKIKNNLEENGFIKSSEKINLTGLTYVTKSSGNNFLTDGQAYILYLQNK